MIGTRRFGAGPRWLAWTIIVIVAGLGLRRYEIDNDIARWTPALAANSAGEHVLIGFERDAVDAEAVAQHLRAAPDVVGVVPIAGHETMNGLFVTGRSGSGRALADEALRSLGDDADRAALAGPSIFRAALDDWSQRGLPLASGLIVVIGAVVIAVATRRVRTVVESVIAVFSSQIVLVGAISATGEAMDMVLSMTPPLLMGLGFSFAAHRALRPDAGRALRLSVVTTAIALASFGFADFRPIRSFALWSALGVCLTWIAVMLLVTPARARRADRVPALPGSRRRGRTGARIVFAAGLAITAAGLAALPRLELQHDPIAYFPADSRIARDYRRLDRDLVGTLPFEVVVRPPGADPTSLIASTDGVRHVMPLGRDADAATYLGLARSDAVAALGAAQPAWQAWAASHNATLQWRGVAAQLDHIGHAVWRTAAWALPMMLVVAGAAAYLVDRRWSSVVLSMWINGFPVAALSLALAADHRAIGLPTLLISALAVGVAIDDTLHLLVARQRLGSFALAVRSCRRPCVGSSVAMAACMSAFALCPFHPTAEFGLLMATAVLAALAGDLLLLPAATRILPPASRG